MPLPHTPVALGRSGTARHVGEVTRAGHIFKFFAGECLRLAGELLPSVRPGIGIEITREPIGVVGEEVFGPVANILRAKNYEEAPPRSPLPNSLSEVPKTLGPHPTFKPGATMPEIKISTVESTRVLTICNEPKRNAMNVQSLDMEDVAEMVRRATLAKLNPAHAAAQHMISRQTGSIVFVTSEGGRVPSPGQTGVGTYAAGLMMATKIMAKELARFRVRVNCIALTLDRGHAVLERIRRRSKPAGGPAPTLHKDQGEGAAGAGEAGQRG